MKQHITLLLAYTSDNAEEHASMLSQRLQNAGYQPAYTMVSSPIQLASALTEERWDLVAVDTGEYNVAWQETVSFVRSLKGNVPLLLFTESPDEELADMAMKAGVDNVLLHGDWRTAGIVNHLFSEGKRRKELARQWKELRDEESKYRGMVENSILGIFNARPWMEITGVNPACARIFGFDTPDEMLAYLKNPATPLINLEDFNTALLHVETQKEITGMELRATRKDGSSIWIALNARPIHGREGEIASIEGTVEDITARKELAEMILRAKQEWEKTFDNVPDIIVLLDNNQQLRRANRVLAQKLGKHPRDIIGLQCKDIFGFTDPFNTMCNQVIGMKRGELFTQEMYIPSLQGTYLVTLSPFFQDGDETTDPVGTVMVAHDVSSRIQLEAQLRQSQKMEAIGTLAGGIAHDFNNILGVMMGYTEMSLIEAKQDSPLQRRLQEVLDAGRRARDLIHQILTFSKQEEPERLPVSLQQVIEETVKLVRASLPADVKIVQQIEVPDATVLASPTQLHQVVMNLCANAAHAMRQKGGTLSISLTHLTQADQQTLFPDASFEETQDILHLTIADSGHGIPREKLENIFDPFYTTKGPDEGTGLGLALVHSIVTSYAGAVSVQSEVGTGTRFDIILPAATPENPQRIEPVEEKSQNGGTVMVVDDEEALAKVMGEMLQSLSYTTDVFVSAKEALVQFADQPEKYSLLITDLTMPEMGGSELVRSVLSIKKNMPVIVCTGYSERLSPEEARALGVADYLFKPVLLQDLKKAITQAFSQ